LEDFTMRALAVGTLALLSLTLPASAQMMCAPGQQTQAQAQGQPPMPRMMMGGAGGMCGQPAADDPMADNPSQRQGMMCPCCRNMMTMMQRQQPPGQQPRSQ
jgi:hypothetical protein